MIYSENAIPTVEIELYLHIYTSKDNLYKKAKTQWNLKMFSTAFLKHQAGPVKSFLLHPSFAPA